MRQIALSDVAVEPDIQDEWCRHVSEQLDALLLHGQAVPDPLTETLWLTDDGQLLLQAGPFKMPIKRHRWSLRATMN